MGRERFQCSICSREIAHPGVECPYCRAKAVIAEGASPRILIAVFAAMAAVFALTSLYTQSFKSLRSGRGEAHYVRASALLAQGLYEEAIREFRDALGFARQEPEYRLGLAQALFRAGRYSKAEAYLGQLRGADPTSGIVNLLLARLAAADGRVDEAVSHFRTAIRGRWEDGDAQRRLALRFELVQLLLDHDRRQQLTAELLDLEETLPDHRPTQHRVASLMLKVGLFGRASELYQSVLNDDPRDRVALLGRGDAEFELGNYLTARTQYNRAQALRRDGRTQQRVDLCNQILVLDPTRRGINLAERFRRSKVLLDRAQAALLACHNPAGDALVGPVPPLPGTLAEELDAADRALTDRRASASVEGVEANTGLAERIWSHVSQVCGDEVPSDTPLLGVMAKLAR